MGENVLIGVKRQTETALEIVKTRIGFYTPKTLGLALPLRYQEMWRHGMDVAFYGPLTRYALGQGTVVIHLENNDLYDCNQVLGMALNKLEGGRDMEDTKGRLQRLEATEELDPKQNERIAYNKRRMREKIEMAERFLWTVQHLTQEKAKERLWQEWEQKKLERAEYARTVIAEQRPELSILSLFLAGTIASQLPGYKLEVVEAL